ncbi:type II toxin-antitoxin system VapB family antitoxin [Thiomicrospira cyclica]|jgi:antitoxin VapB|uniref:Virulence-associated protein, putative n=1 Tax=Thiomicrospira cyclica (strain DSM 14477 / JCM 11371 / ALM1) TaxID=717773 RepID=F6DCU1_THICA|nr:type II toxin-antitoxin system VapB family antitoxin [Thiomicrospira cyclica]AEG31677.1 virulence-associated protein, putative [Thiomicrospira cyclica ALM1]
MTAITTTLFKNNQSQAVRLPKSVALDESIKQVVITAIGKTRIITPLEQTWDDWFDAVGVSDDFMNERAQEPDQLRESL